jgi:hypothetical protein
MKNYSLDSEPEISRQMLPEIEAWQQYYLSMSILIPVKLDNEDHILDFFALANRNLPESGQKYLNEITGTPFKAEIAGLTIFQAPFYPFWK